MELSRLITKEETALLSLVAQTEFQKWLNTKEGNPLDNFNPTFEEASIFFKIKDRLDLVNIAENGHIRNKPYQYIFKQFKHDSDEHISSLEITMEYDGLILEVRNELTQETQNIYLNSKDIVHLSQLLGSLAKLYEVNIFASIFRQS